MENLWKHPAGILRVRRLEYLRHRAIPRTRTRNSDPRTNALVSETPAPEPAQQRLFAREPIVKPHASAARGPVEPPEFASLGELHRHVRSLLLRGSEREARQFELKAGEYFPRQLLAQLISAEAACNLRLVDQAEAFLTRARDLVTSASPAPLLRSLAELERGVVRLTHGRTHVTWIERNGRAAARAPKLTSPPRTLPRPTPPVRPKIRKPRAPSPPATQSAPAAPLLSPPVALPDVELRFEPRGADPSLDISPTDPATALRDYRLRLQASAIRRLQSFDTLLALGEVHGVDRYDYQIRTVTRVLREFFGRVLLADEVGLGKTVEACLCLKEYLLRGLVTRVLILVPPSLRWQWRDELQSKFGITATVVDGEQARSEPEVWQSDGVLLASLGLARLEPHSSRIAAARFDMVIVDEAHRLKNRQSRSWQLVDGLRARFLLLLSATPVENDLIEIYNLLSLLKPGLFSTEAEFKRAFVGGTGRKVKDPTRLRALLREVMIRNTRALAEAKLPPRFAATLRAAPEAAEAALYADVSAAVRAALQAGTLPRHLAGEILRAAGSSPVAAASLLETRVDAALAARARALPAVAKDAALLDLLARKRGEKILLFAAHLATLEHAARVVAGAGCRVALFHGSMTPAEKERAIAEFAGDAEVLVASESGGEGFNLQFARTIVNYDLPWNPMRIEQRIGRVHRIGQPREVFIFNLVTAGTLEEEILRVLDEKINMFELVIGEVELILGRLGDDEKEFQELVLEIYADAGDGAELRQRFDELGERAVAACAEHRKVQEFEAAAFGRDLEA